MQKLLENEASIKLAAEEFYQALNEIFGGNVEPMAAIWSHADDVTYLGPQGDITIGWEEVLKSWETQASLNLEGKVEPKEMHIIADQNIGITQNYEVGTNFIYGKTLQVKIRATNTFRKEDGKWKMIMHQTDLIPELNTTKG